MACFLMFSNVPLPFNYVQVPSLEDSPNQRQKPLILYVHKVITPLTINAFRHAGFIVTKTPDHFNASWGRQFHTKEYQSCASWQKINHFAGAFLMGRKDNFHKVMKELHQRIGDDSDFYPKSFLLQNEIHEAESIFSSYHQWIFKPCASSRGRGIHIISSVDNKIPTCKGILQQYIDKPLLITGRKFDIRLYVLVTSISPLKIYIHQSGLGRFATHQYVCGGDSSDLQMHLTNFSLNKGSNDFISSNDDNESIENSKWSLDFLLDHLRSLSIDTKKLMNDIEKVVISSLIAGACQIRSHHRNLIKHRHTSYEIYGFDILLDENLKPYIIEINISPSMCADSLLDKKLKSVLLNDLIKMARIIDCDCTSNMNNLGPCPGIDMYDAECENSLTNERIESVEMGKVRPWDDPVFADFRFVRDFIEEKNIQSNFRRIFPRRKTIDDFYSCFDHLQYEDIVLRDFIAFSSDERFEVLRRSWNVYEIPMRKINENVKQLENELQLPKEEEGEAIFKDNIADEVINFSEDKEEE